MTETFLIWDLGDEVWNTTDWEWDEIRFLNDFIAIDGSVPKRVSRRYINKKFKNLTPEEKTKFITIFLKIDKENIVDKKEVKDFTLTISDIEVVLKTVLKVKITL